MLESLRRVDAENGLRCWVKVKSDKVKCKIKTSYFDFSNQVENVKLALKNYHFTINFI